MVESDIEDKHDRMLKSAFVFLRATFFRWAKRIKATCPELGDAPQVLSVGDTHVENYGTWRDGDGRLVWGINDFDEAASIPYPFDLVRLATSARLAQRYPSEAVRSPRQFLGGYVRGLSNPRPTLLDEHETWMRPYVALSEKDRKSFWREVECYSVADPPEKVFSGLRRSLA